MENSANQHIQTVGRQLREVADGDLTVRLDADRTDDEVSQLSQRINDLLVELDGTLLGIQSFGAEVATETRQLSTAVEQIQATSEEVSESITEISDGTTKQSERLSAAGDELTDLSATIEEVASSADEVAALSADAATEATEGADLAEASTETMTEIQSQADTTVDRIDHLESEMAEITDVVDLIDDIADQTNMLALNASIEAARAGEAGEGFAVVADEVKSLAEETQAATTDVADRVDGVQATTTAAAEDIREMRDTIGSGLETIERSLDTLETIADRVTEANEGVQSISAATDKQAESTQEIVHMIDEVVGVSERTSEESERVSAAAQQQAAALDQMATSVDELDNVVGELSTQLDRFTVSGGADTVALTDDDYEASVRAIEATNEELLELSDAVVTAYTTSSNSSEYPDEINVAGRQRMLSQRIAKQTLLIARNERAGDASDETMAAKDDLASYIKEFQHALDTLDDGGTHRGTRLAPAPSGVDDAIDEVRSVWDPFREHAETVVRTAKFTTTVNTPRQPATDGGR